MPLPTKEKWVEIIQGFERHANFPNCIGAVDGKHIRVVKPIDSGSLFYNYKNYFSILLMAVCDSHYNFTFVDIGSFGKCADSTVFRDSVFYKKLMNNELNIPEDQPLTFTETPILPNVLIGDEGFGVSTKLLRPFGGKNLSVKKRIFNYRLSRARRYIECTFGILTNKWRIFHRPLNVSMELTEEIVKACCVLHNFVRARDGVQFDDILTVNGFDEMHSPSSTILGGRTANDIRDQFADYFISPEGELPWQYTNI
ncbi:protein ALP1-like [Myzus persicae]|uniref:protein ALP1-like n=1 Tax=Myzus persicae TaxID=13164 RepID=UPI000B937974|nr:protein ALP1-like [Myzus persicae]